MAKQEEQAQKVRVGVDLVEIERIKKAACRTPSFLSRIFTIKERLYCERQAYPYEHYAARFAAREACLKALGTGWTKGVRFQDVSVDIDDFGQPHLVLGGYLADISQALQIKEFALSLSHTHKLAVANVIAIPAQPVVRDKDALSPAEEQKIKLNCTFKDARKIVIQLNEAIQKEQIAFE